MSPKFSPVGPCRSRSWVLRLPAALSTSATAFLAAFFVAFLAGAGAAGASVGTASSSRRSRSSSVSRPLLRRLDSISSSSLALVQDLRLFGTPSESASSSSSGFSILLRGRSTGASGTAFFTAFLTGARTAGSSTPEMVWARMPMVSARVWMRLASWRSPARRR